MQFSYKIPFKHHSLVYYTYASYEYLANINKKNKNISITNKLCL